MARTLSFQMGNPHHEIQALLTKRPGMGKTLTQTIVIHPQYTCITKRGTNVTVYTQIVMPVFSPDRWLSILPGKIP
jgi:hypothetical protein